MATELQGAANNSFAIAAGNINADIVNADGPKTFFLRDFISYGDAIRIKLPYIDEGALNQYIWLENHQVHHNDKEDYPAFWNESCKDGGLPGIYAYYQVGKDMLESNSTNDLIPSLTDNLIPGNTINWKKDRYEFIIKLQNGLISNKLSNMGDNQDPFTNAGIIDIGSNPAPFNVVTWHHRRGDDGTIIKSSRADNRKIHLIGLRIAMQDQLDGRYKVELHSIKGIFRE
jgi:hypothetical protein